MAGKRSSRKVKPLEVGRLEDFRPRSLQGYTILNPSGYNIHYNTWTPRVLSRATGLVGELACSDTERNILIVMFAKGAKLFR